MKRYIFAIIAIFSLFSCSQATAPDAGLYIYNSAWSRVDPDSLVAAGSKGLGAKSADVLDVEAAVKAYNAESVDDQLFLYADEVPVEESPNAWGYICDAVTLECYFALEVPRSDFIVRKDAWEGTTEAWSNPVTGERIKCTLYIDHIPDELPIVIPGVPKLYLALVDYTDKVVAYSENWPTEAEAALRYGQAYVPMCEVYIMDTGHDWRVYWDVAPFEWPVEEVIE